MKYAVFFVLFCIAMAAAAPQYLTTWPGFTGWNGVGVYPRTVVAGPTVVNPAWGVAGARVISPGYVGPAYF